MVEIDGVYIPISGGGLVLLVIFRLASRCCCSSDPENERSLDLDPVTSHTQNSNPTQQEMNDAYVAQMDNTSLYLNINELNQDRDRREDASNINPFRDVNNERTFMTGELETVYGINPMYGMDLNRNRINRETENNNLNDSPPVFHIAVDLPVPVFNTPHDDPPPQYEELQISYGKAHTYNSPYNKSHSLN